ncbi:MAG: site-specific integrase [Gammaproteobacteria bacterium]|nr:site-specific integrase [Gammaproteobacteria bacterium]
MAKKRIPGLYKRQGIWHIDKKIFGRRLCESAQTNSLEEAEQFLARRIEELRQVRCYGERAKRTFQEAATRFIMKNQHKRSIRHDAQHLAMLDPFIGNLALEAVHLNAEPLEAFIEKRRQQGVSMRTINHSLAIIRHILNLAAEEWKDERGKTWLERAPKIKLFPEPDLRKPYPLSWEEQAQFFEALPTHLRQMALFAVNTGCRDREICGLRWDWEVKLPEMPNLVIFIVPGGRVKNGDDRLIVCNDEAKAVIEAQRDVHPDCVFVYRAKPMSHMLNNGWRAARKKTGIEVRVHDLKHTFGRRLRAAGVSFEDRQDLLGHRSGRITTHYSSAELQNLYEAANKACEKRRSGVMLTTLRQFTRSKAITALSLMEPQPRVELELARLAPAKVPQDLFSALEARA